MSQSPSWLSLIDEDGGYAALSGEGEPRLKLQQKDRSLELSLTAEQHQLLLPAAQPATGESGEKKDEGPVEIERKFLVLKLPENYQEALKKEFKQGYAFSYPLVSLRIRSQGSKHKLTLKRGKGLSRVEVECSLSAEQAEQIWPLAADALVEKTRYIIDYQSHQLELDIYHGRHQGLYTVECEFDSLEAAKAFVAPAWFDKDLTEDGRYTNAALALHGLPQN